MTSSDTSTTNPSQPGLNHRIDVIKDGLYKGIFDVLASPGYVVDGINNAPRLFGYNKMSEHPFMGSDSIHNGLNSAYGAYNNFIGAKPVEKIDATDSVLAFASEAAPSAVTIGASGLARGAISGSTKIATTSATDPAATGLAKTFATKSLGAAWTMAVHPVRTIQGALGLGTTAAIGDLALNDGRGTGFVAKKAFDKAVSKVTGGESTTVADAWDKNAPEGMKEMGDGLMGFAKGHPEIAKWGSMGLAFLGTNAVLGGTMKSFMGNNPLIALLAMALAALAAWKMSDSFSAAAQNYTPHANANKPSPPVHLDKPFNLAPAPAPAM